MADCLFCKIIAGEIPSAKVYEDEKVLAFLDINPMAPVHILVIPKEHIPSLDGVNEENAPLAAHCLAVAAKIAREKGIAQDGYRVVTNIGAASGQTVPHLHFHILGGKQLALTLG